MTGGRCFGQSCCSFRRASVTGDNLFRWSCHAFRRASVAGPRVAWFLNVPFMFSSWGLPSGFRDRASAFAGHVRVFRRASVTWGKLIRWSYQAFRWASVTGHNLSRWSSHAFRWASVTWDNLFRWSSSSSSDSPQLLLLLILHAPPVFCSSKNGPLSKS